MINQISPSDYFEDCDLLVRQKLGYMYCIFMREWLYAGFKNWDDNDKYIIHFSNDELQKIDVVLNRKIVRTVSRDEWLNNYDTPLAGEFANEYESNEPKFMKYVRFCTWTVPITDSSFIIPINVGDPRNV